MFQLENKQQRLAIIATAFVVLLILFSFLFLGNLKTTVILISLGLFSIGISYFYPRLGILLFLCYLPWAGTLIYSVAGIFTVQGDQIMISKQKYFWLQIAKDLFYFPSLIAMLLIFRKKIKKDNKLLIIFLTLCFCCLLTFIFVNLNQALLHGKSQYVAVGIVGLKTVIGYIPLLFCAYYWLRNKKDLYFLMRFLTIIILIACLACCLQYILLSLRICPGNINLAGMAATKATLQARCLIGGSLLYNTAQDLLRLPGTFPSPWHWAWFLISSAFFAYGTILSDPVFTWRIVGTLTIVIVFVTSVISGQRTSLLLVPVVFFFIIIDSHRKKPKTINAKTSNYFLWRYNYYW